MSDLIQPLEFSLGDKTYFLSKFPAVAGREIVAKYPTSSLPKIGDYKVSEETMLKLMAFVAVEGANGQPMRLTTRALVDNHVASWEDLAKLEWAMLEYNCSFFGKGGTFASFESILSKATPLISQILTGLSAQSSPADKQPSMS